jgi:DNA adenine methylase
MTKKMGHAEIKTDNLTPWASPVLRWAGSKRKLLPLLMANTPGRYNRYVEPFCGSACLFFAIRPKKAILGDINSELINCYNILKKHPVLLNRAASKFPNTSEMYYEIRQKSPSTLEPIDRAAQFVYLNRFCFNGVYRTNKKGIFNVPRGTRTGKIPSEKEFIRCSYALRNAEIQNKDFGECLNQVVKSDFIYLDPPYASSDRPSIEEYGLNSFQHIDIKRLIHQLIQVDNVGASFLLSYSDTPDLIKLIPKHWNIKKIRVRRHVAGFLNSRQFVVEVLISNYMITGFIDEYK